MSRSARRPTRPRRASSASSRATKARSRPPTYGPTEKCGPTEKETAMGKKIKEFVTYWGPSITDWNDGTERRFVIERDEDDLKKGAHGGRKMEKIALDDIFKEGVVTGVDMENGYLPLVLYANDDIIIEVAN